MCPEENRLMRRQDDSAVGIFICFHLGCVLQDAGHIRYIRYAERTNQNNLGFRISQALPVNIQQLAQTFKSALTKACVNDGEWKHVELECQVIRTRNMSSKLPLTSCNVEHIRKVRVTYGYQLPFIFGETN